MSLETPPKKECLYIYKKLKLFYETNRRKSVYIDAVEFDRAIHRFCKFYKMKVPEVSWHKTLGYDWDTLEISAQCYDNGSMELIKPHYWKHDVEYWIWVVLHELKHHLQYPEREKEAEEFADKFIKMIEIN